MPDKVEPIDGMRVDMKDAREFKKTATVKALQMTAPFSVLTLEGPLTGEADDFLLEGVKGERWVVRKEIFEETYELVTTGKDDFGVVKLGVTKCSICGETIDHLDQVAFTYFTDKPCGDPHHRRCKEKIATEEAI